MSNSPKERFFVQILKTAFVPSVPRWQYNNASTPTWRFYWNMDPGAWISSYGEKFVLSPELAVLIPPQTPFSTGADRPFAHFYIHFSLLDDIPVERLIRKFEAKRVILPHIAENLSSFSERQLTWAASAVVNAALLLMPEQSLLPDGEHRGNSIFNKAVRIIDHDPGFSGNCADLAKMCGTSVNTLQRQFLKATGVPVKKWLLNRKMEYAVQLLMYNDYSIKETADRLGFADRYHFSKVFKQYFGITPAQLVRSGGIPLP